MPTLTSPREAFAALARALDRRAPEGADAEYWVPRFLVAGGSSTELVDVGNPYAFYRRVVADIRARDAAPPSDDPLGEADVVYLTFLRTFAALNDEIGTPLKQIAFVAHLSRLGVTVLMSLPTGTIGATGRKGSRGSPFAIADPFAVDASLADPLLPDLDASTQYQAMIHAYNLAGIRCGSIVPLATLSLDSGLIARFPDITYWWRMPPGAPLRAAAATSGDAGAPDTAARFGPDVDSRFADPPSAVSSVTTGGARYWLANHDDGDTLTPASACPDVLAGEASTYTWADVAGVRYDGRRLPNLGDGELTPPDRCRAVEVMGLALAWRAAILGERVFWADVAARVPDAVLQLALRILARWDASASELCERLSSPTPPHDVAHRLDQLVEHARADVNEHPPGRPRFVAEELYRFQRGSDIYDAVVGPWVFCVGPFTRDLDTLRESFVHHVRVLEGSRSSDRFLAGLGNHDCLPPLPELATGLLVATFLLPRGIPFMFAGLEHGSQVLINKEFGFNTTEPLRRLRAQLDDGALGLFNDVPYPWNAAQAITDSDFAELVGALRGLRAAARLHRLDSLHGLAPHDGVVGFRRRSPTGQTLLVVLNTNDAVAEHPLSEPLRAALTTGPETGLGERVVRLAPFGAAVLASPGLAQASAS